MNYQLEGQRAGNEVSMFGTVRVPVTGYKFTEFRAVGVVNGILTVKAKLEAEGKIFYTPETLELNETFATEEHVSRIHLMVNDGYGTFVLTPAAEDPAVCAGK